MQKRIGYSRVARRFPVIGAGAALLLFGLAGAAPAQAPGLKALAEIQPGEWQLREPAPGQEVRSLCVRNPVWLLQLRHGAARCSHFVIEDKPDSATVSYSCPGLGDGRTTLKVESPRLIRIDTQGIADGQPFALSYEGRRTGSCEAER